MNEITSKFHGTVVDPTVPGWQDQLPKREDMIPHDKIWKETHRAVKRGEPVLFRPITWTDLNMVPMEKRTERVNWADKCYHLVTVGILPTGDKVAVVIQGINPHMMIRVPAEENVPVFQRRVLDGLAEITSGGNRNGIVPCNTGSTVRRNMPFKLWSEKEVHYLYLEFKTTNQRTAAVNWARQQGWDTAIDDTGPYYRIAARTYKFLPCGWNNISNYTLAEEGDYTNEQIKYCFVVKVEDFTPSTIDLTLPENRHLAKDRSLLLSQDLETYNRKNTGVAPMPDDILLKTAGASISKANTLQALIMMDCCVFGWHADKPDLAVCITMLPLPPLDFCQVVLVANQRQLLEVKATLQARMSPDMEAGFNDGLYDWPFILKRLLAYNLEDDWRTQLNPLVVDEWYKDKICGPKKEKVKIEANMYVEPEHFQVPGTVAMDVRILFQQAMPGTEKTSLDFYLQMNKLPLKEDMEISRMNSIFCIMRQMRLDLKGTPASKLYNTILKQAKLWAKDPDCYPFAWLADKPVKGETPRPRADITTYGIDALTSLEVLERVQDAHRVARYCCTDSQRCHQLLAVRNVIDDKREGGDLSFTDFYDGCYRAGGMKVRNMVMAEALDSKWNIAISNLSAYGAKDERKYPGAYVLHPRKGLYRDDYTIKRRRRLELQGNAVGNNPSVTDDLKQEHESKPLDKIFTTPSTFAEENEVIDVVENESENEAEEVGTCNDDNNVTDRPCAGLDFSSLYPSEVMDDNCSPEKVILDPALAKRLTTPDKKGRLPLDRWGHPYRLREVDFLYGIKGEPDANKKRIHAWLVQCTPIVSIVRDGKPVEVSTWDLTPEEMKTKPKIIRFDGFGIYAHVLKQLFDRRSGFKARMERFGGPLKFLDESVMKEVGRGNMAKLEPAEQWKRFDEVVTKEQTKRADEYKKKPNDYYKHRIEELKEIIQYFARARYDGPMDAANNSKAAPVSTTLREVMEMFEELTFYVGYFNNKQNTLKVFMNTFYGETGNSQSSFFMVEVAGAITTAGQASLKFVKANVEKMGYRALYGDTDSLYLSCPSERFHEVDNLYYTGKITRIQWWERMIEISMEDLNALRDHVNFILWMRSRKWFLKMAYEEVLWPFILFGKKMYTGIQHIGIPNLAMCRRGVALSEFMKSRSLFIKGLLLKKRGSSEFLKLICYAILQECFCIESTKTLNEIVLDKIETIPKCKWDAELFVRTARYKEAGTKPNGETKKGNVSVLGFMERMREHNRSHPEAALTLPELGGRFRFINAVKFPWQYNQNGTGKKGINAFNRMELFEAMDNAAYEKIVGKVEPDIDHYVTNEVIGQMARFISYHPNYAGSTPKLGAKRVTRAKATGDVTGSSQPQSINLEDENEADAYFKALDESSVDAAHRYLIAQYTSLHARKWDDPSIQHKERYARAADQVREIWEQRYDSTPALILKIIERPLVANGGNKKELIMKQLHDHAKRQSKQSAMSLYTSLLSALPANCTPSQRVYRMHTKWVEGRLIQQRHDRGGVIIKQADSELRRLVPQLEMVGTAEIKIIKALMEGQTLAEATSSYPDDPSHECQILEIVYDRYIELVAGYIIQDECDRLKSDIAFARAQTVGSSAVPTEVKKELNNKDCRKEFAAWLERNGALRPF
jgi:DNA polymerase elongation subunit (family B)